MRPALFIGISAVLTLATLAPCAGADDKPPAPTFSYADGTVTVAASATAAVPTHLNKDYSWAIKDPSNNPLKTKADFKFTGGSDKEPLNATVTLVPGTLKGAYCSASSCIPFTATCTATACTIN
jgi:hypothetical protein